MRRAKTQARGASRPGGRCGCVAAEPRAVQANVWRLAAAPAGITWRRCTNAHPRLILCFMRHAWLPRALSCKAAHGGAGRSGAAGRRGRSQQHCGPRRRHRRWRSLKERRATGAATRQGRPSQARWPGAAGDGPRTGGGTRPLTPGTDSCQPQLPHQPVLVSSLFFLSPPLFSLPPGGATRAGAARRGVVAAADAGHTPCRSVRRGARRGRDCAAPQTVVQGGERERGRRGGLGPIPSAPVRSSSEHGGVGRALFGNTRAARSTADVRRAPSVHPPRGTGTNATAAPASRTVGPAVRRRERLGGLHGVVGESPSHISLPSFCHARPFLRSMANRPAAPL